MPGVEVNPRPTYERKNNGLAAHLSYHVETKNSGQTLGEKGGTTNGHNAHL
jgi:hypothetical protein